MLDGSQKHIEVCPYYGVSNRVWDNMIMLHDAIKKGQSPIPWMDVPIWVDSCFEIISAFEMEAATYAEL